MHNHCPTRFRTGPRKQIALALSLALGLAGTQALATSTTPSLLSSTGHSPAAALMRNAAAAGIALPRDLPYFMELAAKRQAETDDAHPQAIIPVSNCGDSGPGSLRAVISSASSNDVIDLSGLNCFITLSSSIVTSVDSLTIRGNPDNKYTISGGDNGRVFTHNGTGTLVLDGVTVADGRITSDHAGPPLRGGCVYSKGSVKLTKQAQVTDCEARHTVPYGVPTTQGGAIFAADTVTVENGSRVANGTAVSPGGTVAGGGIHASQVILSRALIENNRAIVSGANMNVYGGGIHADALNAKYSVVRNNHVITLTGATVTTATGGGAHITGGDSTFIMSSTFSGNTVDARNAIRGGGAAIRLSSSAANAFEIRSSTIANNTTIKSTKWGGALSLSANAIIRSSTISGNIEKTHSDNPAESKYGAGITLGQNVQLTMTSTIVANNQAMTLADEHAMASDLGIGYFEGATAEVVGAPNFINYSDTDISWQDGYLGSVSTLVRLGPLQDNGGLTMTMMPLPNSPVIDQGSTEGISPIFPGTSLLDQRGSGFPRVVGPQADIGAVEWSTRIFADGFESD